jgi:hypothetical protein
MKTILPSAARGLSLPALIAGAGKTGHLAEESLAVRHVSAVHSESKAPKETGPPRTLL